jgi:hypothetical protein
MLFVVSCFLRLQAMPPIYHIEREAVPIDRLIANLERLVQQQPPAIETLLNLARLHMMAYALKSETVPVAPETPGAWTSQGFKGVNITPAPDDAALSLARQHLAKAIETYNAAVAVDPSHVIARLGRAWCLEQSGQLSDAIAGYRDVLKDVWPSVRGGPTAPWSNYDLAQEVSSYLVRLLDPVRDREELIQIDSRLRDSAPTVITVSPVLIPLADGLSVSDLVNRSASVLFDADGNGVPEYRSWISSKGGWVVFDKHGRGQVDSGRSLFGNVTFWLFWDNGYHAMRSLDNDDDGRLSGIELEGLAIWQDANENGISEPGEVRTLSQWGITSLSCRDQHFHEDANVLAWSPEGVTFEGGSTRPTFDVLLFPADPTS